MVAALHVLQEIDVPLPLQIRVGAEQRIGGQGDRSAGQGDTLGSIEGVDLGQHLDLHAILHKLLPDELANVMFLFQQDEGLALGIPERDAGAAGVLSCQRGVLGAQQHQLVFGEQAVLQGLPLTLIPGQHDVDGAVQQHLLQQRRAPLLHAQLDLGVHLKKTGQHPGQQIHALLGGDAKPQDAGGFSVQVGQLVFQVLLQHHDLPPGLHIALSRRRELQRRAAPLENGSTQILLLLFNRLAEGRLGDVLGMSCSGNVALLADREHILKILHIHGRSPYNKSVITVLI